MTLQNPRLEAGDRIVVTSDRLAMHGERGTIEATTMIGRVTVALDNGVRLVAWEHSVSRIDERIIVASDAGPTDETILDRLVRIERAIALLASVLDDMMRYTDWRYRPHPLPSWHDAVNEAARLSGGTIIHTPTTHEKGSTSDETPVPGRVTPFSG